MNYLVVNPQDVYAKISRAGYNHIEWKLFRNKYIRIATRFDSY